MRTQPAELVYVYINHFIAESNGIEGIRRDPTTEERDAHAWFLQADTVTIRALQEFVSAVQPGALLRTKKNMNVVVGEHRPPPGGPAITAKLQEIVDRANAPYSEDDDGRMYTPTTAERVYTVHCEYETLHPFTDGNGRSGRVLWLWGMLRANVYPTLGFLHHFYYQALQFGRRY